MNDLKYVFPADGDVHPECLRAAKVPLMNQAECRRLYRDSSSGLIDGQICAGYSGGGFVRSGWKTCKYPGMVDTCHGDSGGPLACRSGDGVYKLVGVVNWGGGKCGEVGYICLCSYSNVLLGGQAGSVHTSDILPRLDQAQDGQGWPGPHSLRTLERKRLHSQNFAPWMFK